jgi:hypothetical protein
MCPSRLDQPKIHHLAMPGGSVKNRSDWSLVTAQYPSRMLSRQFGLNGTARQGPTQSSFNF